MRKITVYVSAIIILLFSACKSKKSAEEKAADDLKENIGNMVDQMKDRANDVQKGKEDLEKLEPLSLDDLKKLIPESLLGAKRTGYNVSKAMGAGFATGDYKIDDTTSIKLNIYDCGGPAGAGIYSLQYLGLGLTSIESESEDEYTKTIDYGDGKAYEHCNKNYGDCTLTWFAGGRFLVTLNGDHVGADGLKTAGKELKF